MANTAANVLAGTPLATGGVLIGATDSTLPTDASTALDAAFKAAGFIGDGGVAETVDRTTNKIKAWGGSTVKVVQTEFGCSYKFTFLESLNADVLKAVYGDSNVTTTAATTTAGTLQSVKVNSATLPHKSFVFEVKDGTARVRIVVPDGQITSVGDVTYSDAEVIGYEVTVETFPDTNGNNAYKYLDDGVFSA